MFKGIDHIAIAVWNIDDALPNYVQGMKLTLLEDDVQPNVGVRAAYLAGGNTMIQLIQPTREGPIQDFLQKQGEGLHHLCYVVDSISAVLDQLQVNPRPKVALGGRRRLCCFLPNTPNGLRIELTEVEEYKADKESGK